MERLAPPLKRYTSGAFPSHSETAALASNFEGVDPNALKFMLFKGGWMTESGAPTKKAAADGLVDAVEKTPIWNLENVLKTLNGLGNALERQAVNQELKLAAGTEPQWANLGTIGTYFSVSANEVGKWLHELGYRGLDKMATKEATDEGLAITVEMSSGPGKNQTRKINHWNLHEIVAVLTENGHFLNFDYEGSLKGKGKNSDVRVETVDDRARTFAREFTRIFKDKAARRTEIPELVKKTPKPIQKKAEELLGRPGFITEGRYRASLDRS